MLNVPAISLQLIVNELPFLESIKINLFPSNSIQFVIEVNLPILYKGKVSYRSDDFNVVIYLDFIFLVEFSEVHRA